jgi:hypothetical protein
MNFQRLSSLILVLAMVLLTFTAAANRVLPPLPMSVATKALPVGNLPEVFDQTGGSCGMYWRQKDSNSLLSLEFTRENTDMPVSD